MKIYTFGKKENPVVMLLPGTCCHWKSFEGVIPKLSENFYVLCVSYDGFDETEHNAFVSMQDEAEKIEDCIKENLNGAWRTKMRQRKSNGIWRDRSCRELRSTKR